MMIMKQVQGRMKLFWGSVGLFFILLASMVSVNAAGTHEVTITTGNYNGGKAIQEALDLQKGASPQYDRLTVTIKPGTYNITESFIVYGNTTIEATGATLNYVRTVTGDGKDGKAPILTNYCSGKKGYSGAGNITVNGGTWDFQGKPGEENDGCSMEAFRFMHGSNLNFTNLTMQNLYESHFITIEGVKQVTISGCTFREMRNYDARKEAIHIDCMHNDSMAPSNQDNTVYDDTICNDVTVTGCIFDSVPRGLGTHIAVAGLYPSNMTITNNVFRNITYEAIKAYHYKNVTISGNTITNAGCGIKFYLYADPADCDNDEEGNSNYLQPLKGTATEGVPGNLNAVISGNTIQNISDKNNGFAIQVAGIKDRIMNGITISSNTVQSTGKGNATKLAGIYAKYANNVVISRNKVMQSGLTGILISDSSNVKADGNTVSKSNENGMIAQNSKKITFSKNTITSARKHSIYMKQSSKSKILSNTVKKDKTGGICGDIGCTGIQIADNSITASGKNAIAVLSSKSALIKNNTITSAKNFGIFITKANQAKIQKNSIKGSGNSGIVSEKSTGAKVIGNTVNSAGKYGILFNQTVKSSASKNKIAGAKDYSINYSNNSKNKKWNLKFQKLTVKAGQKKVTGHTTVGLTVSVTVNGKTKTGKTKPNGDFSIATKKLKKGTKVTLQVKDKLGNVAAKTVKVK